MIFEQISVLVNVISGYRIEDKDIRRTIQKRIEWRFDLEANWNTSVRVVFVH